MWLGDMSLLISLSLRKKVSRDDSARVMAVLMPLHEEMAGQPCSSLRLCPKESE